MKFISTMCLISFMFFAACTKLIHDQQSAAEAALRTAMDSVNQRCGYPVELSISSINEAVVDSLAPHSHFFMVVLDARAQNRMLGEIYVFVHNNVKFMGFAIMNNEIAGTSVRC
jgi:hypothetical protein